MFRIEPNLIKAIALVESNLKKDSIGKNRDKNNNIKSLDYWLMQINQMHIPMLPFFTLWSNVAMPGDL